MEENDIKMDEMGSIKITDEVVATVAGMAAIDVPGVSSMSGGIAGGISEILGRKNLAKGVRVEIVENRATIDLFIVVDYGCRIPEVAWNIQENVKKAVETITGLKVSSVNIHIQGVYIEKEGIKIKNEDE